MRILLTGAGGKVGSHTLRWFLARGHSVVALDLAPPTPALVESIPKTQRSQVNWVDYDLTNYPAFEKVLDAHPVDGIVHFGAIPDPMTFDPRIVHNNNVTGSYNVLQTAAARGIKRIVQASSVNAPGLSYTPEGHHFFEELPVTENTPIKAEDAYALSKAICELQASALARFYPELRIASLRFHMCKPDYLSSVPHTLWSDAFAWTSYDACASAAYLSLTSEGWHGHEVFNIVAEEICYEGTISQKSDVPLDVKPATLDLIQAFWKGRYNDAKVNHAWWEGRPRRTTWDYTKAERLLGWKHDQAGEI